MVSIGRPLSQRVACQYLLFKWIGPCEGVISKSKRQLGEEVHIRVIKPARFFMLCWRHGTIGIILFESSGLSESTLALRPSASGLADYGCHDLTRSEGDPRLGFGCIVFRDSIHRCRLGWGWSLFRGEILSLWRGWRLHRLAGVEGKVPRDGGGMTLRIRMHSEMRRSR